MHRFKCLKLSGDPSNWYSGSKSGQPCAKKPYIDSLFFVSNRLYDTDTDGTTRGREAFRTVYIFTKRLLIPR